MERAGDTLLVGSGGFAKDHGVRVAIELHPGFLAYHTDSFNRLREIGGETIGVNFDPSHLFWQGMDPLVCVRALGDAIFHVHAKDTWLDEPNIALNGVLDTKPYTDEITAPGSSARLATVMARNSGAR